MALGFSKDILQTFSHCLIVLDRIPELVQRLSQLRLHLFSALVDHGLSLLLLLWVIVKIFLGLRGRFCSLRLAYLIIIFFTFLAFNIIRWPLLEDLVLELVEFRLVSFGLSRSSGGRSFIIACFIDSLVRVYVGIFIDLV